MGSRGEDSEHTFDFTTYGDIHLLIHTQSSHQMCHLMQEWLSKGKLSLDCMI